MRVVHRTAEITRRCRGRRVLHVGCTQWPHTREDIESGRLLHAEIDQVSAHVIGVDSSAEGLELLRWLNPAWELRQHNPCTFLPHTDIELIVVNAWSALGAPVDDLLGGLARWATPQHELILATPNPAVWRPQWRALRPHDHDLQCPSVMLSPQALCQTLAHTGWQTTDVLYYAARPLTDVHSLAELATHLFSAWFAPRTCEGLLVIARRATAAVGTVGYQRAA